jgi:hypothetical protein
MGNYCLLKVILQSEDFTQNKMGLITISRSKKLLFVEYKDGKESYVLDFPS